MGDEHSDTDAFRGATFRGVDLTGAAFRRADLTDATIRDSDLTRVRIVGCDVTDLRISGFAGEASRIVVNDVEVTAFVSGELDRRHPERVQARAVRTADDLRAVWATVERLWSETRARAERLPEDARCTRVEEEWSFVETLRHLAFAVDVWMGRMVRGEELPFCRIGLPPTDYPEDGAPELGIDLGARPSYAEVAAVHGERMTEVRQFLERVSDAELDEVRTAVPAPAWGEESHSVRACLGVLVDEHLEHRRYALRDLAVLEKG